MCQIREKGETDTEKIIIKSSDFFSLWHHPQLSKLLVATDYFTPIYLPSRQTRDLCM